MASERQPATPSPGIQTDNVSIRIIALAHATNTNEDIHLVLNLDTSIGQLKERLQESLSQHPRPETQRLLYHGRPLTDNNATLRQTLRLEPTAADGPPAHVLYLVVRDDQPTAPQTTVRPQNITPQATTMNNLPVHPPLPPQIGPPFGFPQHAFPPGDPAQAIFQNAMQHHMAIHNQHAQHFANIPHEHRAPPHLPSFQMPQFQRMQPTGMQPTHPPHGHNTEPSISSVAGATMNPHNHNGLSPNNSANFLQSSMSLRVEETIGPNGERIVRRVTRNGSGLPEQVEETIGPNGERLLRRVIRGGSGLPENTHPVERSASAPGPGPGLLGPTGPATTQPEPQRPVASVVPLAGIAPQIQAPQLVGLQQAFSRFNPIQFGNNNLNPMLFPQQPRNPTVYLVSSPTGPEALLFAPNHGYFSTQQSPTPPQIVNRSQSQDAESTPQHQPTPTQPAPPPQEGPMDNEQGQVAIRPQAGQAAAQPARRDGEDFIAMALQRGWLFVRLYMFIIVLSEHGTWRRTILLLLASMFCLLPRNNPLTDILQLARTHFDNLIGPTAPPARPERRQAGEQQAAETQNQGTGQDEASVATHSQGNTSRSQMPTPEEHARRLLREQEERNPNIIRDTIYRVEQAVALFLASLIPGVGERHVRAREEARRIVQEEEQRRRADEEQRAQEQAEEADTKPESASVEVSESSAPESAAVGASTSVDTSSASTTSDPGHDGGLRMRNADSNVAST